MKIENIPADIKSKSLKEARDEIDKISAKLESQDTNLDESNGDYQRLIQLNKHINSLFQKNLRQFHKRKKMIKRKLIKTQKKLIYS